MEGEDTPSSHRFNEYTTGASRAIGAVTGRWFGISPLQVDHQLSGTTGGLYRRAAELWDTAMAGELSAKQVPFLKGLKVNRHQARSIADFYDERDRVHKEAGQVDADFTDNPDSKDLASEAVRTANEVKRLDGYAKLMTELRSVESKNTLGRRSYEFEPYLVGLAREALGRPPLESNPSPFSGDDVPAPILAVVRKVADGYAKKAYLGEGRPDAEEVKDGTSLASRKLKWLESKRDAEAWMASHDKSPAVKDAEAAAKKEVKAFPRNTGKLDRKLGAKQQEWRERHTPAADILESLK
jgi:hypothetical protein